MALPPGAIGSAVRKEKLAWPASGVKSAFPICSSDRRPLNPLHGTRFLSRAFGLK
jgi:hypothetical protein